MNKICIQEWTELGLRESDGAGASGLAYDATVRRWGAQLVARGRVMGPARHRDPSPREHGPPRSPGTTQPEMVKLWLTYLLQREGSVAPLPEKRGRSYTLNQR